MENLLPDTLHRPVDSLTEGGSSPVPSARRPLRKCRLRCRLLGLLRRCHDGQSRAVVSNWRSRLTCMAWAAPAAVLCDLVTRDQQCSLAKVTSASAVAERTYVPRIECGRWASLPEEALQPRVCLRLRTRGGSGPPRRGVCSLPVVGSG